MAISALHHAAKESKIMKFVLGGFIFLAVGGLVFTDINGFFRTGLPNSTVAKVGDVEIKITEFDNGLRNILQQTQMSAEDAYDAGVVNAYLQNQIDSILQAQASDDLNIRLGNEAIAKELKKIFANASRDEIESTLRARGISESQMASMVSEQVRADIVSRLPAGVSNYVPSFMDKALTRIANERRSGTLYSFDASKMADNIQISDADMKAYYEANKLAYTQPEKRTLSIATIDVDDVAQSLPKPSEEELKAEYDARKDDFIVPASRKIEQVVVNDPDKAQAIYETAMEGTPLKEAALKNGAVETDYRATASYEENGLPAELSDIAFADTAKVNEVLAPVKTLVGWHVMKVTSIDAQSQESFDDVKTELAKEMAEQAKYDALYNRMIQVEEMIDSGTDFTKIAKELGLKTTDTKAVTYADIEALPEDVKAIIEESPQARDEVFALQENRATYPVETEDGAFTVIGVKSIQQAIVKPYEDVAADIKKILQQQAVADNAKAQLETIVADLANGKMSMDDVVKKYGATSKKFTDIAPTTTDYNAALIFETPLNGYKAAVTPENKVEIASVNNAKESDEAMGEEEKKSLVGQYRSMFSRAESAYYRDTTKVTVNEDLLATQYGKASE